MIRHLDSGDDDCGTVPRDAPPIVDLDYKAYPVLIVDDDADLVATFRFNFDAELTVLGATSGTQALEIVASEPVAVLVADQRMPDMHGVEVIKRALELRSDVVPIVLTGFTDYAALVRAINLGRIYRYIPKPWDTDELRHTLMRAIEACHLTRENARLSAELAVAYERLAGEHQYLRQRDATANGFAGIVGTSAALADVQRRIRRVRDTDTTVLLEGPSGTGKELCARALHHGSVRSDKLFVPINCGAMADTLLESALFGHRRGAFTGAIADKKGLFQLADGGTLFLDELGEASPAFQVHLLRVLEDRQVRPLGESRHVPVNVRVVAATNRDLGQAVAEGRFREDLFYRLRVFAIRIPPLSERREDIPALVAHLLARHADSQKRPVPPVAPAAMAELERREYRGNVRELSNLIEHALVMTDPGETIDVEHLFDRPATPPSTAAGPSPGRGLYVTVADAERACILDALARHRGRRAAAAADLEISVRWLSTKLQRLGLHVDEPSDE